jgi:flagellar biosynthesis protein FliR
LVAGLVFQLGLALSSRAVPALNLFSTALPLLLLGGGLALWLTAPAFVGELSRLARHAVELFGAAP